MGWGDVAAAGRRAALGRAGRVVARVAEGTAAAAEVEAAGRAVVVVETVRTVGRVVVREAAVARGEVAAATVEAAGTREAATAAATAAAARWGTALHPSGPHVVCTIAPHPAARACCTRTGSP